MKILVTGGAGFIGSWIVDFLIEKKNNVVIVDDLSTGEKENINSSAKFISADITDDKLMEKIFMREKPEMVIHAAANSLLRKSIEEPLFDARVNILGTISVLEACKKSGVKKVVYLSTGGARVGEPEYLPVDENHPLHPLSPYGISKHSAEHYVWMYSKLNGFAHLIFCFGNVYGPRDRASTKRLVPVFIEMIMRGETPTIFGDGKQTRDFIYVEDLAKFVVGALEKNSAHKLFHLANGTQISVNEVFAILKKVSGLKIDAKLVAGIKGEVRDIVLDTTLVKKELGWETTTSLEEGVKKTWEWFVQKNKKFDKKQLRLIK